MKATVIKAFDRPTCAMIADVAVEAVRKALAPYGLHVDRSRGRYDLTTFMMTIQAAVKAPDGTVRSREAEDFKMFAARYNLNPDDLGKTFQHDGHAFTIVGLKMNATRFPIVATREDGKRFKLSVEMVKRARITKA